MVSYDDIVRRSNLEEDSLRYGFADSIASLDAERAEVIRLQLACRNNRRTGDESWTGQFFKARTLLEQKHETEQQRKNCEVWTPEGLEKYNPRFIGGFVESVTLDADEFVSCAERIYLLAPIRHLDLKFIRRSLTQLIASEYLGEIVSLKITGQSLETDSKLVDEDLAILSSCKKLNNLSYLDISCNRISNEGLISLAKSPYLSNLQYVNINGNNTSSPDTVGYGVDLISGKIVMDGVRLTNLGKLLQEINTAAIWINPVDHFPDYPPLAEDF